jgi:purine nucleosidase
MHRIFSLVSIISALSHGSIAVAQEPKIMDVIVDADTANEMDDLYAIAQLIADPAVKVTALNSAHFNNAELYVRQRWHKYDMKGFVPVDASQRENEKLLKVMGKRIPAPRGAGDILGYSWGYFDGAPIPDAPAIQEIIRAARAAPAGTKINVLVLGPLTNIASAVARAPDIGPKISVYSLSLKYDPITGVWDKNDFNTRNDLNATDFLLDRDDVDLTILPVSVAKDLPFFRDKVMPNLDKVRHRVSKHLRERWEFVGAQEMWTMWDLALTMAASHPEMATVSLRSAPPENKRKTVKVITAIDASSMEATFWQLLERLD